MFTTNYQKVSLDHFLYLSCSSQGFTFVRMTAKGSEKNPLTPSLESTFAQKAEVHSSKYDLLHSTAMHSYNNALEQHYYLT